ncbi:MAG: hypothetical protein ACXW3B_06640 [Telluria sp.]
MKQEIRHLLRALPAALALVVAAAPVHAQQPDSKTNQPQQEQGTATTDPMPKASVTTTITTEPIGAERTNTTQQPRDPVGKAAGDTPQVAHESSDSNVPPTTARKQAAEVASGGPARWTQEDTTMAARLRTVHKEIAAGLQEAQGNCRRMATSERATCLKEARAIYQREMAGARARVMAEGK